MSNNVTTIDEFIRRPKPKNVLPPNPTANNGKVKIDISCDHLPTLNALCWQAIAQSNNPPLLFRFAGQWSRIGRDDTGRPLVHAATADIVRHHLSVWGDWNKGETIHAKPPIDVIKDVLATLDPPLPILRRIVTTPVFASDGSLSLTPGYSVASGIYYAPLPGFVALSVSEIVTEAEVEEARQFICRELIVDFPFASKADHANALGLFLLPFARDLIRGQTPNHLIEASMRGSGKTLLAHALLWAATGAEVPTLTEQTNEDDWRKVITSHLLEARAAALIDNVNRPVDSSSLASAWTARTWSDRILGKSELANVPIETIWVMTGNNVMMSAELIRRTIRIRLIALDDKPEERAGFRHADLQQWCRENHAKLAWCAHTIIRWWLQHGSPAPQAMRPMGSYEDWQRVIGGVLHAVGFNQFLGNARDFQDASDKDSDVRAAFVENWYHWSTIAGFEQARASVRVSELIPIAASVENFPLPGKNDKADITALSKWLIRHNEAFVSLSDEHGDYRLQIVGKYNRRAKAMKWSIIKHK